MEATGNKILLELLDAVRRLNESIKIAYQGIAVPDEWLHEDEVLEIFGNTRKTMYNWRKNNKVQSRKFGRYHYYLKSEVYKLAKL